MIRPVLTELLLFLVPFAIYAAFLFATRAGVLDPDRWNLRIVTWLVICALILMIASFVLLAQHSGQPAGSDYVPPHMQDGKLVPGQFR
jgi:hypothetical protein